MLPTDPEARLYMFLLALVIAMFIVVLAAWHNEGKTADRLDESREAAEAHAVEETVRADAAEAELAALRLRYSSGVDEHFGRTLWCRQPADTTLVLRGEPT